jgi:hypothetical protein
MKILSMPGMILAAFYNEGRLNSNCSGRPFRAAVDINWRQGKAPVADVVIAWSHHARYEEREGMVNRDICA